MDFDYSGLYVCDPQKNTLCNKRNCGNPCTMTSHKEFAKDGGADMNVQRAIEILNPAHREHYESIEPVNGDCGVVVPRSEKTGIPSSTPRARFSLQAVRQRQTLAQCRRRAERILRAMRTGY